MTEINLLTPNFVNNEGDLSNNQASNNANIPSLQDFAQLPFSAEKLQIFDILFLQSDTNFAQQQLLIVLNNENNTQILNAQITPVLELIAKQDSDFKRIADLFANLNNLIPSEIATAMQEIPQAYTTGNNCPQQLATKEQANISQDSSFPALSRANNNDSSSNDTPKITQETNITPKNNDIAPDAKILSPLLAKQNIGANPVILTTNETPEITLNQAIEKPQVKPAQQSTIQDAPIIIKNIQNNMSVLSEIKPAILDNAPLTKINTPNKSPEIPEKIINKQRNTDIPHEIIGNEVMISKQKPAINIYAKTSEINTYILNQGKIAMPDISDIKPQNSPKILDDNHDEILPMMPKNIADKDSNNLYISKDFSNNQAQDTTKNAALNFAQNSAQNSAQNFYQAPAKNSPILTDNKPELVVAQPLAVLGESQAQEDTIINLPHQNMRPKDNILQNHADIGTAIAMPFENDNQFLTQPQIYAKTPEKTESPTNISHNSPESENISPFVMMNLAKISPRKNSPQKTIKQDEEIMLDAPKLANNPIYTHEIHSKIDIEKPIQAQILANMPADKQEFYQLIQTITNRISLHEFADKHQFTMKMTMSDGIFAGANLSFSSDNPNSVIKVSFEQLAPQILSMLAQNQGLLKSQLKKSTGRDFNFDLSDDKNLHLLGKTPINSIA